MNDLPQLGPLSPSPTDVARAPCPATQRRRSMQRHAAMRAISVAVMQAMLLPTIGLWHQTATAQESPGSGDGNEGCNEETPKNQAEPEPDPWENPDPEEKAEPAAPPAAGWFGFEIRVSTPTLTVFHKNFPASA